MINPIKYLTRNKDILKLSGIERRMKLPTDTLRKAVSGDQKLPDKHAKPLDEFIKNISKL